jgi:hypothetical protein
MNVISGFVNDYYVYGVAVFLLCFIPFFGFYFIVETPFYEYSVKNYKGLYDSLIAISKINHSDEDHQKNKESLEFLLTLKDKQSNEGLEPQEVSYRELLSKQYAKTFVCGLTVALCLQTCYGITLFINKDLGISNPFVSGILLNLFEGIGYLIAIPIVLKYGRKEINTTGNILILVISLCLLSTDLVLINTLFEKGIYMRATRTCFGLIIKLILSVQYGCIYLYIGELFITSHRALVIALILGIGKTMTGFGDFIVYYLTGLGFHPLSFLWVVASFGLLAIQFLPETKMNKHFDTKVV